MGPDLVSTDRKIVFKLSAFGREATAIANPSSDDLIEDTFDHIIEGLDETDAVPGNDVLDYRILAKFGPFRVPFGLQMDVTGERELKIQEFVNAAGAPVAYDADGLQIEVRLNVFGSEAVIRANPTKEDLLEAGFAKVITLLDGNDFVPGNGQWDQRILMKHFGIRVPVTVSFRAIAA